MEPATDAIAAYLTNLGSRWELQPDKNEIHMAYPSKKVGLLARRVSHLNVVDMDSAVWMLTLQHPLRCRCRLLEQFVYEMFCDSIWWRTGTNSTPPAYQTFIKAWERSCPSLKLKKSMRFTLCDVCVLASESLDRRRVNGGINWKTPEVSTIEQNVKMQYEVRVHVQWRY